jgi:hypothetical protein
MQALKFMIGEWRLDYTVTQHSQTTQTICGAGYALTSRGPQRLGCASGNYRLQLLLPAAAMRGPNEEGRSCCYRTPRLLFRQLFFQLARLRIQLGQLAKVIVGGGNSVLDASERCVCKRAAGI